MTDWNIKLPQQIEKKNNNKRTEIDLPERAATDLSAKPKPIPNAMLHLHNGNFETLAKTPKPNLRKKYIKKLFTQRKHANLGRRIQIENPEKKLQNQSRGNRAE